MNEVENTSRILKDERPLVTYRWCRFGIHQWVKWSKPYDAQRDVYGNPFYYQNRECAGCGKNQLKKRRPLK